MIAFESCKHGHLLTPDNITSWGKKIGSKECRTCRLEQKKRRNGTLPPKPKAPVAYHPKAPSALTREELQIERKAAAERREKKYAEAQQKARERIARLGEPEFRVRITTASCGRCGHDFEQLRGAGRPKSECPKCTREGRKAAA